MPFVFLDNECDGCGEGEKKEDNAKRGDGGRKEPEGNKDNQKKCG